ncbi:MAG: hypothetical protein EPO23_12520 [Xanthobacteraceae bacterium]|nr:MAG: hypothetical protein EPO23_12520 [Xanthobacteraceae bacterium]
MSAARIPKKGERSGNGPVTIIGNGLLACMVRSQSPRTAGSRVLVIDEGEDASTISTLHRAIQTAKSKLPTIVAQVADRRLRRAVQSRLEQAGVEPRPVLVDAAALIAEHFVAAEHLFDLAYWRDQQRLHVVLVGFGHLGQSFLDALVATGIAGELQRPLIRIVTPDEAGTRAFLRREMPEIDKSAEILISSCGLTDLGEPDHSPLVEAEKGLPLTAIFLLLEKPTDTLLAASAIVDLQERHGLATAPLFIGGAGSEEACTLATPERAPRNLGRKIVRIDDLGAIDALLDYILRRRDVLGKKIHEAYLHAYAGKTGAGRAWDTLSETYRRANRRAASHLTQKLWTMGLSVPNDPALQGAVDAETYDNVIKPITASDGEDNTVRRLARLEHERWCADRRLDGWQYGEVRDDARRRHPSLVPFDDPRLTADEIAKDIGQIRFLFQSVVRPYRNGAQTRFVVGVMAGAEGGQPGIPVKMLLEKLSQEPARFVTIVSPLLASGELKAALELVQALDREDRNFSIIVPEWYPDNSSIRAEAAARAPALALLLGRPQTRIAPVGPPGFFHDDVWEDPSGAEAAVQALARYVLERSQAMLAVDAS